VVEEEAVEVVEEAVVALEVEEEEVMALVYGFLVEKLMIIVESLLKIVIVIRSYYMQGAINVDHVEKASDK